MVSGQKRGMTAAVRLIDNLVVEWGRNTTVRLSC